MGAQASLADVATLAGVSLATASRALSSTKAQSVGPELRARVRAAAAELSYVPNMHAQAMRRPVPTIGLIVHDIGDPVAAALAAAVLKAATPRGLIVTIGATGSDPEAELRLIEAQRRNRAMAVILAGSRFVDADAQRWLDEEIVALQLSGSRVVTIGQRHQQADAVTVDNAGGAAALAAALVQRGYRRLAVLAGPEYLRTSEERVGGFRDALAALGVEVPSEAVLVSQFNRDGGYTAMRELLDTEIEFDCVFAVDDSMAMGAMAALRDNRISVPTATGVAGFGDIAALRDVVPGLTTVRLPLPQIGSMAFELATAERSASAGPEVRTVTGTVVLRDSTPPRAASPLSQSR